MANYQNVGTFDLDTMQGGAKPFAMDAAGIASGQAFLTGELEKRDMLVRTPLTSFTYTRDIPIRVGGGWAEYVSAMNVGYGITGGSGDNLIQSASTDGIPLIQANFGKDLWKTHVISAGTRIFWVDMQRGNVTGRNLDQLLRDGLRMTYDKHMDENTYVGFSRYGTTGLVNNANVAITSATGNFTAITPDQILGDINTAILTAWAAAGYDLDAIPNHIIMPYTTLLWAWCCSTRCNLYLYILLLILNCNIGLSHWLDSWLGLLLLSFCFEIHCYALGYISSNIHTACHALDAKEFHKPSFAAGCCDHITLRPTTLCGLEILVNKIVINHFAYFQHLSHIVKF